MNPIKGLIQFPKIVLGWLRGDSGVSANPLRHFADATPPTLPEALFFPPHCGTYLILPYRIVDGDTFHFYYLVCDTARLAGINAPELHAADPKPGLAAKAFLEGLMTGKPMKAVLHNRDKYNRALLELFDDKDCSISQIMLDSEHAVPFNDK